MKAISKAQITLDIQKMKIESLIELVQDGQITNISLMKNLKEILELNKDTNLLKRIT